MAVTIKWKLYTVFFAVILAFLPIFNIMLSVNPSIDLNEYNLVWNDEFEGDTLDASKWQNASLSDSASIRRGGWWDSSMVKISDGCLKISTSYSQTGINGGQPGYYTQGLTTEGLFEHLYGYYEIRCILPAGSGIWSAFWLMNDSMQNVDGTGKDGAEIDVFEAPYYNKLGIGSDTISCAIHIDGYGQNHKQEFAQPLFGLYNVQNNPYKSFNTYGVLWDKDKYTFFINGKKTGTCSKYSTSQADEHMILSVEIGGEDGKPTASWAGVAIDKSKDLCTDYIVDYVRVYEGK